MALSGVRALAVVLVIPTFIIVCNIILVNSQNLLDDGGCESPFSLAPFKFDDKGAKWFQDSEGKGWFMPLMSQFYASVLYEIFHPRSPTDKTPRKPLTFDDIKTMCPTIHCSPGNITIFRAYGLAFTMMCKQGQIGNLHCTNSTLNVQANLVAVLSDSKKYALMNTCFLGKKAWFVMTNTPEEIKPCKRGDKNGKCNYLIIKEKLVNDYQFKWDRSYKFNYANCDKSITKGFKL